MLKDEIHPLAEVCMNFGEGLLNLIYLCISWILLIHKLFEDTLSEGMNFTLLLISVPVNKLA